MSGKERYEFKCQTCGMAIHDDECACSKADLRRKIFIQRQEVEMLKNFLGENHE